MIDNISQNKRPSSGASSSPGFSMPSLGAPPDLFAGFRKELADIEAQEQLIEQRAIQMASKIEQADSSTMFGGDYSEASQYAQWMTDHLDEFAESTDGIIRFQAMVNELNSYIDTSEEYKKMHFGASSAGPKQGSFTGYVGRSSGGAKPYEKDGYMDVRPNEDYERTYIGLNAPRQLQFDANNTPTLSNRGRIENPFMPQLEELPFEGGFEWFENNAKGHRFPDGKKDVEAWLERKAQDPKLERQIARAWKKKSTNPKPIEELLDDDTFMEGALQEFYNDALASYNSHSGEPKPEKVDKGKTVSEQVNDLFSGAFVPSDIPTVSADGDEGGPIGSMLGSSTLSASVPSLDTGFDSMYEFKKPITSVGLPENTSVVGFNVDGLAQMYVTIQRPKAQATDANENLLRDGDPGMVFETIKLDPNSTDPMITGLYNTMKIRIPDQIVSYLMNLSRMNTSETDEVTPQEAARRTERDDRERQLLEEEGLIQTSAEQERLAPAFFEKGGTFRRFFGLS